MKTITKVLLGVGALGAGYFLYQRFAGGSVSTTAVTSTSAGMPGGMLQATAVLAPPKVMTAPLWNPKGGAKPTPDQLSAMAIQHGLSSGATSSMFWGIGTQSMADYADPQITQPVARGRFTQNGNRRMQRARRRR